MWTMELYPSSKVHQLRQLMSLDCPYVTLTSSSTTKNTKKFGSHKLKLRPSSTTTRNKTFIKTRTKKLPSSASSPCLICTYPGSNKSLISTSQKLPPFLSSLLRGGGGGSRDLEGEEESWVFCKVCLGTITKLLRLLEEVDDIKARISAVLKLRGKLEEDKYLNNSDKDLEVEECPDPRFIVLKDEYDDDDDDEDNVSNQDDCDQLLGFGAQDDEFNQEEDGTLVNACHSVPEQTDDKRTPSPPPSTHDDTPSPTLEERSKVKNIHSEGRQRKISSSLLFPPCYFCNKTFPSATTTVSSFQAHLSVYHTLERPHLYPRRKPRASEPHKRQGAHKCPKCGNGFSKRSSLLRHMRDIHSLDIPKKNFKHFCSICKKFFASDLVFQAHSHPNPSSPTKVLYTCAICNKTFNNRSCFHQHKARHQGPQKVSYRYRCYFCSNAYQDARSFQSHMRTHTSERLHPCPKCGKGFTTGFRFRSHKDFGCGSNSKITRRAFKCSKCGNGFTKRSGLLRHMRDIHSLDIPKKNFKHFCSICKKFFASDLVFQAHSHPNPSSPTKVLYTCAVCNKTFNNRSCFHQHKARHQDQKFTSRCYFCNIVCKNTSALQYHMRTHTLERRNCGKDDKAYSIQCHLCGKVLGSRSSLLTHMNWAHEEKTKILLPASATTSKGHVCPKCGKMFEKVYRFCHHMKRAHLLDPILPPSQLTCPTCSRVFVSREIFQAHTHPDKRDPSKVVYVCNICRRSYGSTQSYSTHKACFHRDQDPGQCQSCGRVFQSARAANIHRKLCSSSVEAKTCSVKGCDQVFPTPRERVNHERVVHKGLSSTKCALCSKFFRSAKDLKDHARTHTRGERN